MKRMLSLVCVLASGLGAGAVAQAAPARPDAAPGAPVTITGASKIAVINFQQAVGQTNEFQRDLADLRKKYEPRAQALQTLNDQIEAEKKALQDGGTTLSDAERQQKLHDIDDKTKNLQRSAQDLQNDEQSDGQETFQQVGQKVFDAMSTYAQQHGFGVVLDASQQNSGVLWLTPGADITSAVVEAYNVKSGIPAPAAVPSAPTPHPAAPRTPTH
ncbi:MAG TPA: OmpH family outer membrane protein [Acidobacteriaceae bacterium]|nr:OmpH family outer membrane protein [Acidobacteriaceae bacterium]